MRTSAALVLLLLLASAAPSQESFAFCDLLRHADDYNDKVVTVRATLKYGFEMQELYCLNCRDAGKVWLELVDDTDSRRIERVTKGMGLVNLTVRGRFATGRTYGHENGYRSKIVAFEIRDIVRIAKGSKEWQTAEEQSGCGGIHPK